LLLDAAVLLAAPVLAWPRAGLLEYLLLAALLAWPQAGLLVLLRVWFQVGLQGEVG
jgi:hypothetical protein